MTFLILQSIFIISQPRFPVVNGKKKHRKNEFYIKLKPYLFVFSFSWGTSFLCFQCLAVTIQCLAVTIPWAPNQLRKHQGVCFWIMCVCVAHAGCHSLDHHKVVLFLLLNKVPIYIYIYIYNNKARKEILDLIKMLSILKSWQFHGHKN